MLWRRPPRDLPPNAELRRRGVSDREYFQRAVLSRKAVISEVVMSRADATPAVVVAAPYFTSAGDVAGVACGILELQSLAALADQLRALPHATITILDQYNRVIYATAASGRAGLQDLTRHRVDRVRLPARRATCSAIKRSGGPQPDGNLAALAVVPGTGGASSSNIRSSAFGCRRPTTTR